MRRSAFQSRSRCWRQRIEHFSWSSPTIGSRASCARACLAKIAARAMTFERARKRAFMTLSQIGISYPKSTLSQSAGGWLKGAPQAGDRFPWVNLKLNASGAPADIYRTLDDRRFNLLVFGSNGSGPGYVGDFRSACHRLGHSGQRGKPKGNGARANPASSFFLLRPDGHIGLCGTTADMASIPGYLSDCMRVMGNSQPAMGLQARRAMAV